MFRRFGPSSRCSAENKKLSPRRELKSRGWETGFPMFRARLRGERLACGSADIASSSDDSVRRYSENSRMSITCHYYISTYDASACSVETVLVMRTASH